MNQTHFEHGVKEFSYKGNYETWDIPDLVDLGIIPTLNSLEEDIKRIKLSEDTFEKIKMKVDKLTEQFSTTVSGDS